jgi:hypothetical protein
VPIYSCSGNCIDVFRRYLSNFEGGANNQEFDDLLKSFIAKYYPSFRESGKLEIVEGKPEFYDIRYEFIENGRI